MIARSFYISAGRCQYDVHIGSGLEKQIAQVLSLHTYSKAVFVIDRAISSHSQLAQIKAPLPKLPELAIEIDESRKNIETCQQVWKFFSENKIDRKSLICVVGGGAVTDLVGFSASTYMRGVKTVYFPTTLLAQADAAIGGKTGLNHDGIKNLIGTFHQPQLVICDTMFLKSLPIRHLRAGLAEIIKITLVWDREMFIGLNVKEIVSGNNLLLTEAIWRSCKIKGQVVELDETESGVRRVLNFGHTIGHALEAAALDVGKELLHGEAVAIGMIAESHISFSRGWINEQELEMIHDKIFESGLPTQLSFSVSAATVLQKIAHDKKSAEGRVFWTLLRGIGAAESTSDVLDEHILAAMTSIGVDV